MGAPSRSYDGVVSSPPSLRYFRSLLGAWSGDFDFRAKDGGRTGLRALGALARVFGPVRMATTLDPDGDGFVHTTRVSKWGVTLYETTEHITLGGDGRSLAMKGEQRAPFRTTPYESTGEIDEHATRATYRIPWAGLELVQRTRIVDEGLELEQETAASFGKVLLRRAPR